MQPLGYSVPKRCQWCHTRPCWSRHESQTWYQFGPRARDPPRAHLFTPEEKRHFILRVCKAHTGCFGAAILGEIPVCCARLGSPVCAKRDRTCPPGPQWIFLQHWSRFSLLCPSTPARPPCTAGYNTALGNRGSCSRLKLEKCPEKGILPQAGRLTQPPAAAEAILDCGTTESQGPPRNQSPRNKTRNILKRWKQTTNTFSTIGR